jgi:hypothetical protein
VFSYPWTAPASGTGNVVFYFSGLAVNGNGATSGDSPTPGSSVTLTEASATFAQNYQPAEVTVYPTVVNRELYVVSNRNQSTLRMYDINGRQIFNNIKLTQGTNQIDVNKVPSGLYFVKVGNQVFKIIKE